MGKSGCSSVFSDLQADTSTWGLDDGKDGFAISSEKLAPSLRSEGEVDSKENVVDHEEESGLSKRNVKGKYKCDVCGVLLLKPSLLKQHMCSHSKDDWAGNYTAKFEGLPDPIPNSEVKVPWTGLVPEDNTLRSFVCPVENCGRQYKRQDHLNRHSLTHKSNLFPCTWEGCDLSFNVNSNLQRHLKLHEKWDSTLRGSNKADAQLMCPESGCGKTFKYPSLLQTHIDNVHDSLSISQAVCMEPGCGEIFETRSQLKMHTRVAHCFAFCETCGVSMLKTSLAAHARKHQGEQVLLRCPHPGCLHSYNKNSNLNTHIRAVHMDLKPYTCAHDGCELRFAYKSVRDKHEQCSTHSNPLLGGDFEAEDLQHRLKSRGGRKRLRLQSVDDLLPQKWRNHSLH